VILAIEKQLVRGASVGDRLAFASDAGFDGLELRDAGPDRLPELEPLPGVHSPACRLRGEPADAVRACGRLLRGLLDGDTA
jgi:hypothetical protein